MIYISLHQGKWELGKKLESPFSSPYRWLGPALLLPPPPNPNFYSSPCIKLLFKATLGLFPPKPSRIQRMGMLGAAGRSGARRQPEGPEHFILNLTISVSFKYFPPPPLTLQKRKKKIIHPHLRETQSRPIPKPPSPPRYLRSQVPTWSTGFFPPSPGAPQPQPLFLISLGEVAISGDLGFLFFFPAGFLVVFNQVWGFFSMLESPWWLFLEGGSWWLRGPFFGGAWEGPSSSCCCWGPAQLPLRRNSKGGFSCPGQA